MKIPQDKCAALVAGMMMLAQTVAANQIDTQPNGAATTDVGNHGIQQPNAVQPVELGHPDKDHDEHDEKWDDDYKEKGEKGKWHGKDKDEKKEKDDVDEWNEKDKKFEKPEGDDGEWYEKGKKDDKKGNGEWYEDPEEYEYTENYGYFGCFQVSSLSTPASSGNTATRNGLTNGVGGGAVFTSSVVSRPFASSTTVAPDQQAHGLTTVRDRNNTPHNRNTAAPNSQIQGHDPASHQGGDICEVSSVPIGTSRESACDTGFFPANAPVSQTSTTSFWDPIAGSYSTEPIQEHTDMPFLQLVVFSRGWPDQAPDTVCGWGSSEPHTRLVRKWLSTILKRHRVTTLNDAGCGDLAWMSTLDLDGVDYIGYDVHERATWPELRRRGYRLEVADITADELRPADLLICRDVFIHLPNDMILRALERFRRSTRLLLTTSYTSDPTLERGEFSNFERMDEPSLRHAKLDLALPPFGLGQPLERIPENSPNKYLGLWDMTP